MFFAGVAVVVVVEVVISTGRAVVTTDQPRFR